MKTTVLALAATCLLLACKKNEEPVNCYSCDIAYAAFGHGTQKTDTLCGTSSEILMKESDAYISNDSIQQSMSCHLIGGK